MIRTDAGRCHCHHGVSMMKGLSVILRLLTQVKEICRQRRFVEIVVGQVENFQHRTCAEAFRERLQMVQPANAEFLLL